MLPVVPEWEVASEDSKSHSSRGSLALTSPQLSFSLYFCTTYLTQPSLTLLKVTILDTQFPSGSNAFEPGLKRVTSIC